MGIIDEIPNAQIEYKPRWLTEFFVNEKWPDQTDMNQVRVTFRTF